MPQIGYLDTSVLVALAFSEPGHEKTHKQLKRYSRLVSLGLIEAEFMAAISREGHEPASAEQWLQRVDLFFPMQSLAVELRKIFALGRVRGADAYHVAGALWLAQSKPSDVDFLTLDKDQGAVAHQLGFWRLGLTADSLSFFIAPKVKNLDDNASETEEQHAGGWEGCLANLVTYLE